MANGFFLGGMAEGMQDRAKLGLAEQAQAADVGLRTRGLDIQEKTLQRAESQDAVKRVDERISDTMTQVSAIIKESLAAGRDPQTIMKAVGPLVESAKPLAAKVGRDPAALDAQVRALLMSPTGVEAATGAGVAAGTKQAATEKTLATLLGGETGVIRDPVKKVEVEGKMRDDYAKANTTFITQRDFKDRMDIAPKTGAGDIMLVFSYMKVLDPTSTVREGEFATAANAGGAYAVAGNLYNKLINGDVLPEKSRKEIREAAEAAWKKASARQSTLTNRTAEIAKGYGINPKNVIIDPSETGAKPDPLGIR